MRLLRRRAAMRSRCLALARRERLPAGRVATAAVADAARIGARIRDGEPRATFAEAVALYERGAFDAARPRFHALLDVVSRARRLPPRLSRRDRGSDAATRRRRPRSTIACSRITPRASGSRRALARRARIALALGDPRAEALASARRRRVGRRRRTRAASRSPCKPRCARRRRRARRTSSTRSVRRGGGEAAPARPRRERRARGGASRAAAPIRTCCSPKDACSPPKARLELAAARLESAADSRRRTQSASRRSAPSPRRTSRQGRLEDAIATYRTRVAAEPPGGMARFELATLALEPRSRRRGARRSSRRSSRETPPHPKRDTARYALGRIAEQEGRTERGRRAVPRASPRTAATATSRARRAGGSRGCRIGAAISTRPRRRSPRSARAATRIASRRSTGADASSRGTGRDDREPRALRRRARAKHPTATTPTSPSTRSPPRRRRPTAPTPLALAPPPSIDARTPTTGVAAASCSAIGHERRRRTRARRARRASFADGGEREPFLLEAYSDVEAHGRALKLAQRLRPGRSRRRRSPPTSIRAPIGRASPPPPTRSASIRTSCSR